MTILTAGSCAVIMTSHGNVIPAMVGSATGLFVSGIKLWFQSEPLKAVVSAGIGAGSSSGALAGAAVTKTYTAGLTGALAGGLSSGALSSLLAGFVGATSGAISSSPLGMLTVGTSKNVNHITFDCWKQVVHDTSEDHSDGITLSELASHPNVESVECTQCGMLPHIVINNVWNQRFEIEYVFLEGFDKPFCHVNEF